MLEFLKQFLVQERQLDRVADRLKRFLLATDFFPGQFGHFVEVMITRLRAREQLERDPIIRIHPDVVARFQRRLGELRGALQDQRLRPVFRADAQSIRAEDFGDLGHRPGGFETEIADNHVGFVDQNARSLLQLPEADPRVDVAIIISAADDDLRGVARRAAEESADPICGRSHFLDHLLELFDHLARVAHHLFLRGNLGAEGEETFPGEVVQRQRGDRAIKCFEQTDLALVVRRVVACRIWFPFVAHFHSSLGPDGCSKNDTRAGFRPQTSCL